MSAEREELELKIGWDLSIYTQEEITTALNSRNPVEVLLKFWEKK